ncbi:MAG: ABC transporter permease, partial [Mycobacteriales bacterium]
MSHVASTADGAAPSRHKGGSRRSKPARAVTEGTRAERRLGWLLCAPAALVMLMVAGWPIIYSILLSFQRYDLRFPAARGW